MTRRAQVSPQVCPLYGNTVQIMCSLSFVRPLADSLSFVRPMASRQSFVRPLADSLSFVRPMADHLFFVLSLLYAPHLMKTHFLPPSPM